VLMLVSLHNSRQFNPNGEYIIAGSSVYIALYIGGASATFVFSTERVNCTGGLYHFPAPSLKSLSLK
jgi:hypothetical protein